MSCRAALVAGTVVVVAIGFIVVATYIQSGQLANVLNCEEKVVSASESPDKANVAIAATTTCRTPARQSTHVRVGPRDAPARVYAASDLVPVVVRWADNKTVVIGAQIGPEKVTKRDAKAGDISIVYEQ